MRIAVITANMGNFDKPMDYVEQSIDYDFYEFNDSNFLPRICSMTPRLQARIPKMFAWQMVPDYDCYLWVDRSYSLRHKDSVKWFVEQLGDADIAVLKHPMRNTIQEEADYIKDRLSKKCSYMTLRYRNELVDEQLAEIKKDGEYIDNCLYASTALIYQNNDRVRDAMIKWWYHTSRFHCVDQLSLPYVLWQADCKVNVIATKKHHDFKIPYLTLTRYL